MPTIKLLKNTSKKKFTYNPNSESRKKRQQIYQSKEWKNLRQSHFMNHPLCERCLEHNVTTAGEDVHHLISFTKGTTDDERKALAFNPDNVITVCRYCHLVMHNQKPSQFEDEDKFDRFIEK